MAQRTVEHPANRSAGGHGHEPHTTAQRCPNKLLKHTGILVRANSQVPRVLLSAVHGRESLPTVRIFHAPNVKNLAIYVVVEGLWHQRQPVTVGTRERTCSGGKSEPWLRLTARQADSQARTGGWPILAQTKAVIPFRTAPNL